CPQLVAILARLLDGVLERHADRGVLELRAVELLDGLAGPQHEVALLLLAVLRVGRGERVEHRERERTRWDVRRPPVAARLDERLDAGTVEELLDGPRHAGVLEDAADALLEVPRTQLQRRGDELVERRADDA